MMTFELVAVAAVLIFAVLAAFAVRTLIQARRTLGEVERLALEVQRNLLPISRDVRPLIQRAMALADDFQRTMQQVNVFSQAIEELGGELQRTRAVVRGGGEAVSVNLRRLWYGLQAISTGVGRRITHGMGVFQRGGNSHAR
jgi:uncharacterized protein YoxC